MGCAVSQSMHRQTTTAITLSILLFTACTVGSSSGPAEQSEVPACATDLSPHLEQLGVPGLSAGIVKNGRLVCTAVAGLVNIDEDRLVEPDTLFAWRRSQRPSPQPPR